jgi:hypothetical protein
VFAVSQAAVGVKYRPDVLGERLLSSYGLSRFGANVKVAIHSGACSSSRVPIAMRGSLSSRLDRVDPDSRLRHHFHHGLLVLDEGKSVGAVAGDLDLAGSALRGVGCRHMPAGAPRSTSASVRCSRGRASGRKPADSRRPARGRRIGQSQARLAPMRQAGLRARKRSDTARPQSLSRPSRIWRQVSKYRRLTN